MIPRMYHCSRHVGHWRGAALLCKPHFAVSRYRLYQAGIGRDGFEGGENLQLTWDLTMSTISKQKLESHNVMKYIEDYRSHATSQPSKYFIPLQITDAEFFQACLVLRWWVVHSYIVLTVKKNMCLVCWYPLVASCFWLAADQPLDNCCRAVQDEVFPGWIARGLHYTAVS